MNRVFRGLGEYLLYRRERFKVESDRECRLCYVVLQLLILHNGLFIKETFFKLYLHRLVASTLCSFHLLLVILDALWNVLFLFLE